MVDPTVVVPVVEPAELVSALTMAEVVTADEEPVDEEPVEEEPVVPPAPPAPATPYTCQQDPPLYAEEKLTVVEVSVTVADGEVTSVVAVAVATPEAPATA